MSTLSSDTDRSVETAGFGYRAVGEKETDDFSGCVGLWQLPDWPELELGCWLLKAHQVKGYALEACLRCIAFTRETLNARSLVSYMDARNVASIRLAGRLGARFAGTIELAGHRPPGVFRDF